MGVEQDFSHRSSGLGPDLVRGNPAGQDLRLVQPERIGALQRISYSQIREFLVCPFCFQERKKDHVRKAPTEETVIGEIYHDLINGCHDSTHKGEMRYKSADRLVDYWRHHYKKQVGLMNPELAKRIQAVPGAIDRIDPEHLRYYYFISSSGWMVEHKETDFEFDLTGVDKSTVRVNGRMDQIRRLVKSVHQKSGRRIFDGPYQIWDFKNTIPLLGETPSAFLGIQLTIESRGFQERYPNQGKPRVLAYEIASGNTWELKGWNESLLTAGIVEAANSIRLKYAHLRGKHEHNPDYLKRDSETAQQRNLQPDLGGEIHDLLERPSLASSSYQRAWDSLVQFGRSCVWEHKDNGCVPKETGHLCPDCWGKMFYRPITGIQFCKRCLIR